MPINKNMQIVANLANQVDGIISDPTGTLQDIQNLKKILMECALGDAYQIDDVLKDIDSALKKGADFSEIAKDPNKIVCYPIALFGLAKMSASLVSEVTTELYSYYRGFGPFFKDILNSLNSEFNLELVGTALQNAAEERISQLLDMGIGFAQSKITSTLKPFTDKIYTAAAAVGRYIALAMVFSKEFRYILYLTFLKNMATQTKNRISSLIKLRKAISTLAWEIDKGNTSTNKELFHGPILDNYRAALKLLDTSTFLSEKIKRDIITKNIFPENLNEGMKKNFERAEVLLTKQTNTFLDKYLAKDEYQVESTALYQYYFPIDFSKFTGKKMIYYNGTRTNTVPPLFNIPLNLESINSIFITKKFEKDITISLDIGTEPLVDTETAFWIKLDEQYFSKDQYLTIDDGTKINLFIVKQYKNVITEIPPKDPTKELPTYLKYQFLLIERTNTEFTEIILKENLNGLSVIGLEKFNSSNYSLLSKNILFDVNDTGFKITEFETQGILNCLVSKQPIKDIINSFWNGSKEFKLYMFLASKDTVVKKIQLILNGTYPEFVEQQEKKKQDILSELPEPFKNMYSTFEDLKTTKVSKLNIGQIKKNAGNISEFIFGKNILGELDNTFGINNYSYTAYLESATELLKTFCPLKNSILSYYSYLDSLENLEDTTESASTKVTKDWTLFINQIIEKTLKSMTELASNGEYQTIDEIKKSPVYYKLLPSLLADYDNVVNLRGLANLQGEYGKSININNELDRRYTKLKDLITWLKAGNSAQIKEYESQLWAQLSATLTSTVGMILRGERVSSIKPALDLINRKIVKLAFKLNTLLTKLQFFSGDNIASQTDFVKLLDDSGLEHWVDYIESGQLDKFMNADIENWAGKYSPAIKCLKNLMPQFSGTDKQVMSKILSYLKYIDVAELATNFELGLYDLGISINMNLLTGLPKSGKGNLKNTTDKIKLMANGKQILEKASTTK